MRVALDHRAEAVVEVPHLVAVDVPDLGAVAALQVDRPRLAHLVAGRHPGGEVLVGAREGLAAALGRLVEALGLALGQLRDACAIDRDGLSVGGHGQPIVGVVVVPVCTPLTRADAGSYNGSAVTTPATQVPKTSTATATPARRARPERRRRRSTRRPCSRSRREVTRPTTRRRRRPARCPARPRAGLRARGRPDARSGAPGPAARPRRGSPCPRARRTTARPRAASGRA